jgi:hypothetical protein
LLWACICDSTIPVATFRAGDLGDIDRERLRTLSREELEELAWRAVEFARSLAGRNDQNSTNSSRPPASDDPWRRRAIRERAKSDTDTSDTDPSGADTGGGGAPPRGPAPEPSSRRAGQQPGKPGHWRKQRFEASAADDVDHDRAVCPACAAPLGPARRLRQHGAHRVYELEGAAMELRICARMHRYWVARCDCGRETIALPGTGACSTIEGRRRNLRLSERGLIGPQLAAFIAALSIRYRLSRTKIAEFLRDWLGLELGAATIERCVHEFGLACEPVVKDLTAELRAAGLVHLDETPWYEKGVLRWLWVASSAMAVVFRIGTRAKDELSELIGEAYLGWLVSDGYAAYRDHPRRQRCLAHLIRKAVAVAHGYHQAGAGFGRDLARDLRRLIERVADGDEAAVIKRLVGRIKWACQCNQFETDDKVRGLARELLNDWDAVMAFVDDPVLPPTNNDAERALRHAVIARRISFGTRTSEGSRFYAAALSVVETCRRRGVAVWVYAGTLIAAARTGQTHPGIPHAQPPCTAAPSGSTHGPEGG